MTSAAQASLSEQSLHRRRTGTLIGLMFAAAAETWTSSGISLTLTDLTGTLSASSDEASWALTVYTTAYAVAVVCAHRLSSLCGNRVFLTSMAALFSIASLGCAISDNLVSFLAWRAAEGFAGGAFLIRTFVFTGVQFDPPNRPPALITWGLSYFILGRLLSPIVNGWFSDHYTWRALFVVGAVLSGIAVAVFARFTLYSWHDDPEEDFALDAIGVTTLVVGVVCIQTFLSRGDIDAWFESTRIVGLLILGIAANAAFAAWELHPHNRHPLFDLTLIRMRSAFSVAVIGFPLGIVLAGSVYVLPQYLRTIETHSAFQTGLLLSIVGAASVATILSANLVLKATKRFGGRAVVAFALLLECASQLLFAHYVTVDTPDRFLWIPLACNGTFIALSIPTLGLVVFSPLENRYISTTRTIYYGARQFGASLGVTCAVVLIDRRLSLHTSRLLDAYVNRNLGVLGAADPQQISLALHAAIRRQAFVLAYADVFRTMALIALLTLLFLPLLPIQGKPGENARLTKPRPFTKEEQAA